MLVVELLRLQTDRVDDAGKHRGECLSLLPELFVRVPPRSTSAAEWIRISSSNRPPAVQWNIAADIDAERQHFFFEQRPNVEPFGISEVREAEEKAVGDEVAGKVAFQDERIVAGLVISIVDAVGRVGLRRLFAERKRDFAGSRGRVGLLVDVEQLFITSRVKVFGDGASLFAGASEERVESPVERGFAGAVGAVDEQVAAFWLESETAEGLEVGDLDPMQPRGPTCPSFLMTASRSGLVIST